MTKVPAKKPLPTFKEGDRVKWTRRNGEEAKGRVYGSAKSGAKGSFIPVNTGDKNAPVIAYVRPSQLKKF